jgi:hypothetical protein
MKYLLNCKIKTLSTFLILFLAIPYLHAQDDADDHNVPTCSNESLRGQFGFKITGTNLATGPFAFVGRFEADGLGNIIGKGTEAIPQGIFRPPFSAVYAVQPDCTGVAILTFNTETQAQARLDFVIVDDGKEILFLDSDRGVIESGAAKKQFKSPPGSNDRNNSANNSQ